jgi:hypothetical protein
VSGLPTPDYLAWKAAGQPQGRWHWVWRFDDGEFPDARDGAWGVAENLDDAMAAAEQANPNPKPLLVEPQRRRWWKRTAAPLHEIEPEPGHWWCELVFQRAQVDDLDEQTVDVLWHATGRRFALSPTWVQV